MKWNEILQSMIINNVKARHGNMVTCSPSDYIGISNIHEMKYAENADQKCCDVTHKLLAIGKDVTVRLSLTKVQCHSHPFCHKKDVMRLPFTNMCQCHSLPVGHMTKHDEIAFQIMCNINSQTIGQRNRCEEAFQVQMCNVTYILLVM